MASPRRFSVVVRRDDSPIELPSYDEALTHLPLHDARKMLLEHFERHYLLTVLDRCEGNVAEAARRSGIDRVTLFRAIRRFGLRAAE
jgi:transcriptional regulator of acetoin/glycerol metabolism